MRAHQTLVCALLFVAGASFIGCDAVERARSRFGTTTTDTVVTSSGSGLALGLQVPPALDPDDQGLIRLSLNNLTDTTVADVRLELILPGWAEPMPPRIGERPVTMVALEDGSTGLSYRMVDAPLAPKQVQTVEQRIRVPAAGASMRGGGAWTRIVRARLLTGDGRPLAQVESEIAVDSAALAAGRTGSTRDTTSRRDTIAPSTSQ